MGDDAVGGGDLRGARIDDSLDRVGTESHKPCCDEYNEGNQERVLDHVLAVLILPQGLE